MLLGGPTPGAVGSCGGDELAGQADVQSYCTEREQLICVRQQLRREISIAQSNQCRRDMIERCKSRAWAPQCKPSERAARACLAALRSLDTVDTKESEIEECSMPALCSVKVKAPTSIGDDAGMGE